MLCERRKRVGSAAILKVLNLKFGSCKFEWKQKPGCINVAIGKGYSYKKTLFSYWGKEQPLRMLFGFFFLWFILPSLHLF